MATGLAKSLCDAYTVMGEEIDRLRAENERLKDANTQLSSEVAMYRGEAAKFRDLLNCVPLPPVAITYEHGWKLIDRLQAFAINAAQQATAPPAR